MTGIPGSEIQRFSAAARPTPSQRPQKHELFALVVWRGCRITSKEKYHEIHHPVRNRARGARKLLALSRSCAGRPFRRPRLQAEILAIDLVGDLQALRRKWHGHLRR